MQRPEETGRSGERPWASRPSRSRLPYRRKRKMTRPDPADVFRGNITMAGKEPEKEAVPFDEDLSLSRPHRRTQDVFSSRSSRGLPRYGRIPGGRQAVPGADGPAQAVSGAIPEAEAFQKSWEEPGETLEKPGEIKNAEPAPVGPGGGPYGRACGHKLLAGRYGRAGGRRLLAG